MLALCWHNVPAYYALNYAGIFDGGLTIAIAARCIMPYLYMQFTFFHMHDVPYRYGKLREEFSEIL